MREVRRVAVVVRRIVISARITKSERTISISEKPFLVRKKDLRKKEGINLILAKYVTRSKWCESDFLIARQGSSLQGSSDCKVEPCYSPALQIEDFVVFS